MTREHNIAFAFLIGATMVGLYQLFRGEEISDKVGGFLLTTLTCICWILILLGY